MRLHIVSDGTGLGTHVTDENGDAVEGVMSGTWTCDGPAALARVTLVLEGVPVDVVGESAELRAERFGMPSDCEYGAVGH